MKTIIYNFYNKLFHRKDRFASLFSPFFQQNSAQKPKSQGISLSKKKSAGRVKLQFFPRKGKKGQIVVEYILLLVVSTVIALLLINLVTVEPSKNRPVFEYWKHLLQTIGKDIST